MQVLPTVVQRLQQVDAAKANRVRTVESLPHTAEDGDMVLLGGRGGVLHIMVEGYWASIDDAVMGQVKALQERLDALEGNNG